MNKISFQIITRFVKFLIRWQTALTILLLLCFSNSGLAFDSKANSRAREERLKVFDEVWETIRELYYDENFHGIDWQAQRESYRLKAASVDNSTDFYRILRTMVGALNDSHTRVYTPDERSDWRNPRFVGIGISVREIENKIVVTSIEKNSPAAKINLKIGDTVTAVNGIPTNKILARRIAEQTGASTAAVAKLRAAAGIFEGVPGSILSIEFKDYRGRQKSAALPLEWRNAPTTFKVRRENDVLIINFDTFALETVREFYKVLNQDLRNVRGIILDLRQNRGGSAEAMTDIASAFLPEDKLLGRFIDRTKKTVIDTRTRRHLLYTAASTKAPAVPLVVLTGTATASAAEIFAAALKGNNRARIVGNSTCGCVLAVKGQHVLPDGGALEVSQFDFQLANGLRLEGIGVTPDEKIISTRKDLLQNRDRALQRALKILR